MGYVSIGERIAILRRRRGMSQAAVAGRLGRSVQWLSNIERGVRSPDRYSILVPIADVMGVTVADLTGDRPPVLVVSETEHESARPVRLALAGYGFGMADAPSAPEPSPHVDFDALSGRVRAVWALVHEARYGDLGRLMPDL